jgi:hypothetical protein
MNRGDVEIARRKRNAGPSVQLGGSARKSFRSLPTQNASPEPLNKVTLSAGIGLGVSQCIGDSVCGFL